MSFSIRPTRPGDARSLPAIERAAAGTFRTVPGLSWVADSAPMAIARHVELLSDGTHWVAEDARRTLVGFAAVEREVDALHVCEMSVHARAQRQGIGAALLEAVIAHARRCALPAVTLTTFSDVPWNAPFYARLGFAKMDGRAMGPRLADILANEAAHGLPRERRCAMRYTVLAPIPGAR